MLPLQGAWVGSLIGELRLYMLRAMGLPNPPKSGGLFKGDKAYAKHPQIYKEIKIKTNKHIKSLHVF